MSATDPDRAAAPAAVPIRELTLRAFVLGGALALILGAANAYLGLYAGMTVSASIPAAVISMAALRMLGRATILENNVVQTVASAGEAVAAGAIFTFPALIILGDRGPLPYWTVTLLCLCGATMGSLLIVFLRRAYIVEERLPYPEGVACAAVLRLGETGGASAAPLGWGAISATLLKFGQDILGVLPSSVAGARWFGAAPVAGSLDLSAALLGVGYIVGVRIAALVFTGGAIGWLVAIPAAAHFHPELRGLAPADAAARLWSGETRYLGVGAMLVGGAITLARLRGPIGRGLAESLRTLRTRGAAPARREDRDLPPAVALSAVGLCIPVIFTLCYMLSQSFAVSAILAFALAVIGFFATTVAGYLTGIVGASNNPVSGVTIIVLLAVAILLELLGVGVTVGPRLAIITGAVVCTAAAMAGDSLHDLATGYHVGATPRALEIAVLFGAVITSFIIAPMLNLLISAYGIAGTSTAHTQPLAAPQAFLMAKVADGVFRGGLPLGAIAIGAVLAAILAATDHALERADAVWRTPVMPVAIGLYLPFGLGATIFAGALIRMLTQPGHEASDAASPGLLFAAGMVAGEALTGVAAGLMVTLGVKLPLF